MSFRMVGSWSQIAVRCTMRNDLFIGLSENGWDRAPWDTEPEFSPTELDILLDRRLSVSDAAERVGCVEHDVQRIRDAHAA